MRIPTLQMKASALDVVRVVGVALTTLTIGYVSSEILVTTTELQRFSKLVTVLVAVVFAKIVDKRYRRGSPQVTLFPSLSTRKYSQVKIPEPSPVEHASEVEVCAAVESIVVQRTQDVGSPPKTTSSRRLSFRRSFRALRKKMSKSSSTTTSPNTSFTATAASSMTPAVAASSPTTFADDEALTTRERDGLAALRAALVAQPKSDATAYALRTPDHVLLRFLHGHHFDEKRTLKFVVNACAWRVSQDVDTCPERWEANSEMDARVLKNTWPWGCVGRTAKGEPILVFRLAKTDLHTYMHKMRSTDIVDMHVARFERNLRMHPSGGAVFMLDLGYAEDEKANAPIHSMTSLGRWISSLTTYIKLLKTILDPYYPETFTAIVFTRTPGPFHWVFKGVRYLIAKDTMAKIHDFTPSKNHQARECLERFGVAAEQVPDFLYDDGDGVKSGLGSACAFPQGGRIDVVAEQERIVDDDLNSAIDFANMSVVSEDSPKKKSMGK